MKGREISGVDSAKNTSGKAIGRTIDRDLLSLPGGTLLKRILDNPDPEAFVRRLSAEDLFWIVKRIGEDDCLPVLELADEEQWQYLIDLDIWEKDQLSPEKTLAWLKRLAEADPKRFSNWLLGEERHLLSLLLFRVAEVVVKDQQEEGLDLPEAYFTLDGVFYIKAFSEENQEMIEALLNTLARNDPEAYQEFLYRLAAIIPAEAQEELYRIRNARIAEHGFVPFEEALSVYAPIDLTALKEEPPPLAPGKLIDRTTDEFVPALPLLQMGKEGLFPQAVANIPDQVVFERISIEFADLANRIIAAGNFPEISDPDVLGASCVQATGYLNIALERLCNKDISKAKDILDNHSLLTLFRTGYGLAVDLQNEARRWRQKSWFFSQGWKNEFWGEPWGEVLDGLLTVRPLFYSGDKERETYRDFKSGNDLDETRKQLRRIEVLDRMLARLSLLGRDARLQQTHKTFHSILFNRWAHKLLEKESSFEALSQNEADRFFHILREGETDPPFRMPLFKDMFLSDFMEGAADFEPGEADVLREALGRVWENFCREYEDIKTEDIEGRFSPFVVILPSR
jgi:hypothetical protein